MGSLAQHFTRAVQWNVALSIATIPVQFSITAILARLLTPSDFGLFAVANVVFVIAVHLGSGLIQAIIREPVLDDEITGSVVLLSCILSVALASFGFLLAPLAALGSTADERSVLEGLVRFMSLSILISGITVPAQAIMQRELRFRELGIVQFAGIVLGTGATTMIFALANSGAWSLAYGSIANLMIISAGCWWKLRDRWSILWHTTHIIRIGYIGTQMSLLRVLDALWYQLPLIIAHAQLSSFDVGVYQRAQTIVDTGIQSTSGRVNNVLFPIMASQQDRAEFIREFIPPLIGLYSIFLFSVTAFVAIMASDIVALVLGPKWNAAAGPLILIMIAFASLMASQPASSQLEAHALIKPRIIGAGFGATCFALCGLALVGKYGLMGIAIAGIVSGVGTTIINIAAIVHYFSISPRTIVFWAIPSIGVAVSLTSVLMVCYFLLSREVESPAMRIVAMAAVAAFVFVIAFRLFLGESKRQILSNYLSPRMTWSAVFITRILGLRIHVHY